MPREEIHGCRMAKLRDILIDRRILLNVRIRMGNVCLGLVIVIIGDEVGDRIIREERLKFATELRCECLIMRNHKGL